MGLTGTPPTVTGGPMEGEGVMHPPTRERQEKGGGVRVAVGVWVALSVGVGEKDSQVLALGWALGEMEREGDKEGDRELEVHPEVDSVAVAQKVPDPLKHPEGEALGDTEGEGEKELEGVVEAHTDRVTVEVAQAVEEAVVHPEGEAVEEAVVATEEVGEMEVDLVVAGEGEPKGATAPRKNFKGPAPTELL